MTKMDVPASDGDDLSLLRDDISTIIPCDLHTAASLGDDASVMWILASGTPCDRLNKAGWTALMYGSFTGNVEVIDRLLHAGADVNKRNPSGLTPLMLAATCGNDATAIRLLQHSNCSADAVDNRGWTALYHATHGNHGGMVRLLLQHKANPDVAELENGYTPLMLACREGHEMIVQYCLDMGADVSRKSCTNETARSLALMYNQVKIVGMLDRHVQAVVSDSPRLLRVVKVKPLPRSTSAAEGPAAMRQLLHQHQGANSDSPRAAPQFVQEVMTFMQQVQRQTDDLELAAVVPESRPRCLEELLVQIGLSEYLAMFTEQQVDLGMFLELADADLKEIGVKKLGPRRKMTNAIARWHAHGPLSSQSLEQVYANYHLAQSQELTMKLERTQREMDALQEGLEHEHRLREVIEETLARHRSCLQQTFALLRNVKVNVAELLSSVAPDDADMMRRRISKTSASVDQCLLKLAELHYV